MSVQTLVKGAVTLTIAEARAYLRIDNSDDDGVLSALIYAATEWVQDETGQQVIPATLELTLDQFPTSGTIKLPRPPMRSVTAVRYFAPDGSLQTLDPAAYTQDVAAKPGRIVLKPGHSWPTTDGRAAAVQVEFEAGPSEAKPISDSLKQAIKFMVGHWYEHREGATDRRIDEVPLTVRAILDRHTFPEAV